MNFSELPDEVRVKLSEKDWQEFWHRVDEFGGVSELSDAFKFSASKMYNWRSKRSFLPVSVVKQVFGAEGVEVDAFKGGSNSRPVENPDFPMPEQDEFLTRVSESVTVAENGNPVYQANDRGLLERFAELLEEFGDVPYRIYSREMYELRYPVYLHRIFEKMDFEEDFAAKVDESGTVRDGELVAGEKSVPVKQFQGELYHREKALELALERNNSERIAQLIGAESERVRKAVGE